MPRPAAGHRGVSRHAAEVRPAAAPCCKLARWFLAISLAPCGILAVVAIGCRNNRWRSPSIGPRTGQRKTRRSCGCGASAVRNGLAARPELDYLGLGLLFAQRARLVSPAHADSRSGVPGRPEGVGFIPAPNALPASSMQRHRPQDPLQVLRAARRSAGQQAPRLIVVQRPVADGAPAGQIARQRRQRGTLARRTFAVAKWERFVRFTHIAARPWGPRVPHAARGGNSPAG
jgi:hypothetical protein